MTPEKEFKYIRNVNMSFTTETGQNDKISLLVIFKSQNKLSLITRFKDPVPQILTSSVVFNFQCGFCNESCYGESVKYLAVSSGEHIGISALTNKRVQARQDSAVCHHLLNCNYFFFYSLFNVDLQ